MSEKCVLRVSDTEVVSSQFDGEPKKAGFGTKLKAHIKKRWWVHIIVAICVTLLITLPLYVCLPITLISNTLHKISDCNKNPCVISNIAIAASTSAFPESLKMASTKPRLKSHLCVYQSPPRPLSISNKNPSPEATAPTTRVSMPSMHPYPF